MDGFQNGLTLLVVCCVGLALVVVFPIFIWFLGLIGGVFAGIL